MADDYGIGNAVGLGIGLAGAGMVLKASKNLYSGTYFRKRRKKRK